jgi:hypothetical protein
MTLDHAGLCTLTFHRKIKTQPTEPNRTAEQKMKILYGSDDNGEGRLPGKRLQDNTTHSSRTKSLHIVVVAVVVVVVVNVVVNVVVVVKERSKED